MKRFLSVVSFFFSFRGRINRTWWWLGNLALYIFFHVLFRVLIRVFPLDATLILLVILFWCIPATMLSIKRLHDQGKSGWWLWRVLVLFGGTAFLDAAGVMPVEVRLFVPVIALLWCVFRFGFGAGDAGENRWGA